jgi:formate/nitrite transporter FocA (FNT family)
LIRSVKNVPDGPLQLTENEQKDAENRSSVTAHVVHEAVRREGEEELKRTPTALAWSGLAAGLSMGFSMIGEGILHSNLPDAPWRPLVAKFGYSAGFLITILGRQQLFTENTLTPMLPLFHRRDRETLYRVARLWAIVLVANVAGALAVAWVLGNTEALPANVRASFGSIATEAVGGSFGTVVIRGIFAGWLIALLIWVLPFTETARFFVIVAFAWLVGVGGFAHVVAGSVETFLLWTTGAAPFSQVVGGYLLPALIGNIIGGVSLVAVLNHAQVVS